MLINEKAGSVNTITIGTRRIDKLLIEWYEANKRIMHKQTQSGKEITLKFLQQNPDLKDGDILWEDEDVVIAVEIKQCEAIVIKPATIFEAASACYEIGNKHLQLFYEGDELLVPYEAPLYRVLQAAGYIIKVEERKLTNAVKTSVSLHLHQGNSINFFNKVSQPITST